MSTKAAKAQIKLNGKLVIRKKSLLDFTDVGANLLDSAFDLFGRKLTLQLISTVIDSGSNTDAKVSKRVPAGGWILGGGLLATDDVTLGVTFQVDEDFGVPGAFTIRNEHVNEFYLKSFVVELPQKKTVEFPCNAWVYNASKYKTDRIFFSNKLYLPKDTPTGLRKARDSELQVLRGNGTGVREEWDRVYDYATYNDLGNPDSNTALQRPILGGSAELPYPRRCRTGRAPMKKDKTAESLLSGIGDNFYVPSDEAFSNIKEVNFLTGTLKAAAQSIIPILEKTFTVDETFDSLSELKRLYVDGVDMSDAKNEDAVQDPFQVVQSLSASDTGNLLLYPLPSVIKVNEKAWLTDEEFARQMLSGLNPIVIELLTVFPPESELDPAVYGPPKSAMTEEHIKSQLEGATVEEALKSKKLYVLDYHDAYMPYLAKINSLKGVYAYASRTILYLKADGTLKPVAIELSSPPSSTSTNKRVFLPPASGKTDWLWNLAKAHVTTNDSGYHQLISHWLRTHAVMEPFIIATHRNLSALHPLNPFLIPHFKNTLSINARARESLINADGIIEKCFSTGKYSMEISSVVYKSWRFDEQGLPADLLKRNMATKDANAKHGLRLNVEDYPYAADGLEVWSCIETWTRDYINTCYKDDAEVASDAELQAWWNEIITQGHGDRKNETWWVKLNNKANLVDVLTTMIWLASAHHAAVNFGQYAYAGYMPNHPTATHRGVPVEGSKEYSELLKNPEEFFLSAVSTKSEATSVMTAIEILSTHASDEEYLGQRAVKNWTDSKDAQDAFARFAQETKAIETLIKARNSDKKLKNRSGPVQIPYTLLYPTSTPGHTGRGIPNSVSI